MTKTSFFKLIFAATVVAAAPQAGWAAEHPPAQPLDTASSFMDEAGEATEALIEKGLEYVGIRYRYGSNNPALGLDCSGFVQNVFRSALALDLPRSASDMARLGEKVGKADLKPGDLVFFNTMRRTFSHVGIYLGEGRFMHSASRGGGVRIDSMGEKYWTKRFTGARRLVDQSLDLVR